MRTISVALATYNGERWLPEQLRSIAAQSLLPDELVVSDDASQDETVEVVRQFAAEAPFHVELIENAQRLGFARNFERALARCGGDVVFLADQDDIWLSQKLAIVAQRLSTDLAFAFHDAIFVDEGGEPHGPSLFERYRLFGHGPDWGNKGCCSAFRSDVVRRALPLPTEIAHDAWLHNVARILGSGVYIHEPLVHYRIHRANAAKRSFNQLEPAQPSTWRTVKRRVGYVIRRPSVERLESLLAEAERLAVIAAEVGNMAAASSHEGTAHSLRRRLGRRYAMRRIGIRRTGAIGRIRSQRR